MALLILAGKSEAPQLFGGVDNLTLTPPSNGVRFSISSLLPATARIMPTIFQDRAAISLYDAQFTGTVKSPISDAVISQILVSMRRFAIVCADYGVPAANIRVVATEATRDRKSVV